MEAFGLDLLSHGPIGAAVAFLLWMAKNHNTRLKAMSELCDGRHDRQLVEDGKLKTEQATQGQTVSTVAENMKAVAEIVKTIELRVRANEISLAKVAE